MSQKSFGVIEYFQTSLDRGTYTVIRSLPGLT